MRAVTGADEAEQRAALSAITTAVFPAYREFSQFMANECANPPCYAAAGLSTRFVLEMVYLPHLLETSIISTKERR